MLYSQRVEQVLIEGILESCFPFCHGNGQLLREGTIFAQDRHHYSASFCLCLVFFPYLSLSSSFFLCHIKEEASLKLISLSPPWLHSHIPFTSKLHGQALCHHYLHYSNSSDSLPVGFHFYALLELPWLPKGASWQNLKVEVSSRFWP